MCLARHYARSVILCALVTVVSGCGPDHGAVPVSGKVTFQGGRVPGPGKIQFLVEKAADGFPNRPVVVRFDADGNYAAQVSKTINGVYPGSYKILIECWETPPNFEGKPVKNYIDEKYNSAQTSGLELEIKPGDDPIIYDVDL